MEFLPYKQCFNYSLKRTWVSQFSTVAYTIAQELIHQSRRIYFCTCGLLFQELLAGKRDLKLAKVLKKLSRYDAMVIDDIGYVEQSKEEMDVLFTFLVEQYERGSLMLTI